jgi:hypothetical protein
VQCSRAFATKNLWAGLATGLAGPELPRTARNDTPAGTHAVHVCFVAKTLLSMTLR